MEGEMTEAGYKFCTKCNLNYALDVLYCSQCGALTVPRSGVKPIISTRRKVRKALLRIEYAREFTFLRFVADLITVFGVFELVCAWLIAGIVFFTNNTILTGITVSLRILIAPSQIQNWQYFLAALPALLVWIIITLLGVVTVAQGELVKLFISQYDEIQNMNAVLYQLALFFTHEPD